MVDLAQGGDPKTIRDWIELNEIKILNVAGPRESQFPGIHNQALIFLRRVLKNGLSFPGARESQRPDGARLSRHSDPSLNQVG